MFGRDEAAMSCEIGLYFDFKVEDGIPYGCPGMETFNADHWDKGNLNISMLIFSLLF